MQVYIEYAIIDNFVIDYMLLKVTFALTGKPKNRKRLFLCSFLGTLGAVVMPIVGASGIIKFALKIMVLVLMTILSSKKWTLKRYLHFLGVFLGVTFLTGGSIYALAETFKIDLTKDISIALIILPVFFVTKIFVFIAKILYRRSEIVKNTYKIEMNVDDKRVTCYGFFDTGNSVYLDDSPVVFCDEKIFRPLITDKTAKTLSFVSISTIAGTRRLPTVKIDSLAIYFSAKPNINTSVTVCLIKNVKTGYDMILHPALYKGERENETDRKTKKIS